MGGVPARVPVPRGDGGMAGKRGFAAGASDRDRHAGDDAGLRAVRPGGDAAARIRAAGRRRDAARCARPRGIPAHDDPADPPPGSVRQQGVHRHSNNIEYDEDTVRFNGKEVADYEDMSPKEYAYDKLRKFYSTYLSNQFENLIVLTGSGSSIGIGADTKKGKTMKELWETVTEEIGKEEFSRFCEAIKFDESNPDLEALLSRAISAQDFVPRNVEGMIRRIQNIIKEECTLILPENSHHELFLKKLTSRKLKYPRLKIFTLNYDTLFEQAASRCGYTIIDGFSYSFPRRFLLARRTPSR